MFGAGPIEMLAREMTEDLIAIREAAAEEAADSGVPVTRSLETKGVDFGEITVMPDGLVDPTAIEAARPRRTMPACMHMSRFPILGRRPGVDRPRPSTLSWSRFPSTACRLRG